MQILKPIKVGQAPNDQTGDTLRDAMVVVNENFAKTRSGVDAVEVAAAAAQRKADAAIPAAEKGAAGGVTPLDASGKVPAAHLPEPAIPLAQKAAPGGATAADRQHSVGVRDVVAKSGNDPSGLGPAGWADDQPGNISGYVGERAGGRFADGAGGDVAKRRDSKGQLHDGRRFDHAAGARSERQVGRDAGGSGSARGWGAVGGLHGFDSA